MKDEQNNWFAVQAQGEQSPVEVLLYDELFDTGCNLYGGVCPAPFIEAMTPYREREILVRINSPGGSAFAGLALYNYLKDFPKLSTTIDGIAASAASVVMLAAPKGRRSMAESAFIMIHGASGVAVGPKDVMADMAQTLAKLDGSLAEIYSRETGVSQVDVRKWMSDETWFTGDEALKNGFVSSLSDREAVTANFDLSRFRRVPRDMHQTQNPRRNMSTQAVGATAPPITDCGCGGGGSPTAFQTNKEELAQVKAERDALKNEIASLKALIQQLKGDEAGARKARAVAAIDQAIQEGRLQPPLREPMIARYQDDEAGTIEALKQLRPTGPGTTPIRTAGVPNGDLNRSMLETIEAEPDPKKRISMRNANWYRLGR
jgi:ATP-dependent Clp protease protease subunit